MLEEGTGKGNGREKEKCGWHVFAVVPSGLISYATPTAEQQHPVGRPGFRTPGQGSENPGAKFSEPCSEPWTRVLRTLGPKF